MTGNGNGSGHPYMGLLVIESRAVADLGFEKWSGLYELTERLVRMFESHELYITLIQVEGGRSVSLWPPQKPPSNHWDPSDELAPWRQVS